MLEQNALIAHVFPKLETAKHVVRNRLFNYSEEY